MSDAPRPITRFEADGDDFLFDVARYLDGLMTDDQVAALFASMEQNDALQMKFVATSYQHRLMQSLNVSAHQAGDDSNFGAGEDADLILRELINLDPSNSAVKTVDITEELKRRKWEKQEAELCRHDILQAKDEKVVKTYVIPKPVFYGMIAAVIAMTTLLFWPSQSPTPQVFEENPAAPQFVQVAKLMEQVDAHWIAPGNAPGSHSPAPGDALLNQKIHLTSGLAKIRFNNEAEVILEAPCSIKPVSASEIEITHGKLVGRCGTAASKGFVVQTPGARIVDLGTEFGVTVDRQGASQAHVFEGEIKLVAAANDQPIYLFQGQARQVDTAGTRVSAIETDELAFVRGEEFEANAKADQSPYHRWLSHSYKLRRDPDLVAYYPFDNQSESPDQLLNLAVATDGQLDGRLESQTGISRGPQWTTGRFGWPKQALRFNAGSREQARVDHHPALNFENAVTITIWVRVDDPDQENHLLTKRIDPQMSQLNNDAINFVWVGDRPNSPFHRDYAVLFHTHRIEQWVDYETDSILKNRFDWVHLAVTYDQSERVYYLNGQVVGRIADDTPIQHNTAPLLIGGVPYYKGHQSFDGLMDELAIFNKALSEQDIHEMYEAGKP